MKSLYQRRVHEHRIARLRICLHEVRERIRIHRFTPILDDDVEAYDKITIALEDLEAAFRLRIQELMQDDPILRTSIR